MGVAQYQSKGTIGANLLPSRYDIDIYKGDTFSVVLNMKDANNAPVDLTGMTGTCQIKDANNAIVATVAVTVNYNATVGAVQLLLQDTSVLAEGTYTYDFQLTDTSSHTRTYIGGVVTVTGDIST